MPDTPADEVSPLPTPKRKDVAHDSTRDLKVSLLYEIGWLRDVESLSPSNATLAPIAASFGDNTRRLINGISLMPHMWMVLGTVERMRLRTEAEYEQWRAAGGEGDFKQVHTVEGAIASIFNDRWSAYADENFDRAVNEVGKMTEVEFYSESFVDLMFNQIVGAWTAYEVLATDLWVEAVNRRPKHLGKNAWIGSRQSEGDNDESGKKSSRGFDVDLLDEYDFNLSESMGTMMWRKRLFDFNSLRGLVAAYKMAFRVMGKKEGQSGAMPELNRWFSGPDHDQLKVLEAIRHATVHRGGRADVTFLERMEGHPFGQLRNGEPIPLDGEVVQKCTEAAVKSGIVLLMGVDEWLTKNSE